MMNVSRWDENIGLFKTFPGAKGHTMENRGKENLHAIPNNLHCVYYAAEKGCLHAFDYLRVLKWARKCQSTGANAADGQQRGHIKWYLEDNGISDGNSTFFCCMSLVPLRKYHAAAIGEEATLLIDQILAECLYCFLPKKCSTPAYWYSNAVLGHYVMAWILNEMYGTQENGDVLKGILDRVADYSLNEHWGWGEHLSDTYGTLCVTLISMLLLMSEHLPVDTRDAYKKLLAQLLAIKDTYRGKVTVPAIRSYMLSKPQIYLEQRHYREKVSDRCDEKEIRPEKNNCPNLGPLFNQLGWHEKLAPPRTTPEREVDIPCFDNAKAMAIVESDFRIGAFDRYPIMQNVPYLDGYVFPLAFFHDNGDWGFLQWESQEEGEVYGHPCSAYMKNYHANSPEEGLSAKSVTPIGGRTFALRKKNSFLLLRNMPVIFRTWNTFKDRLRIVRPSAKFTFKNSQPIINPVYPSFCYSILSLEWPNRRLSVARVSFRDTAEHKAPKIHQPAPAEPDTLDWDIEYPDFAEHPRRLMGLNSLWIFSLNAEIDEPPEVHPVMARRHASGPVSQLNWNIGEDRWRVNIRLNQNNALIDKAAPGPF